MDALTEQNLSKIDNFKKYHHVRSTLISGSLSDKKYKYSIVIPTYKRVDTLKDTIDSAVCQDYKNDYGIVVVDNNPERNDSTEIYIQSLDIPNLLYYKNAENIGMVGNWNRCLELCNGAYMIMVHDDDILYPNFITICERILDSGLNVDLLYPLKDFWYQEKEDKPQFVGKNDFQLKVYRANYYDYLFGNGNPPTGMLVNRQKAIEIGGFVEGTYPSADYYFNVKAVRFLNVYCVLKKLFIYRWGGNATLKLSTLQGFVKQGLPLRIWLMNKIKIPLCCKNILLKTYCYNFKKEIIRFHPSDYKKIDFTNYLVFKNSLERVLCLGLIKLGFQFIKLKKKKKVMIISQ